MPDIFVAENNSNKDAPSLRKGVSLDKKNQCFPKVRFENQHEKEEVILLLRQHYATQLPWIIGSLLGLLVPMIFNVVPVLDFLPGNYQFMVMVGWYLLLVAYVYEKFISWYYQVFIITNDRVIDINFYNLIYKEVSEARIEDIEDVTYSQGGVLRAMFNYGDVVMQTAGEKREFAIESAAEPNKVVKVVNELKLEQAKHRMFHKDD